MTPEYVIITLTNNIDIIGILGLEDDFKIVLEDPMTFKQEQLLQDQKPVILMQRYLPYSKEKFIEVDKMNIITITHPENYVCNLYDFYVDYCDSVGDDKVKNEFEYSLAFAESIIGKGKPTIESKPINKLVI